MLVGCNVSREIGRTEVHLRPPKVRGHHTIHSYVYYIYIYILHYTLYIIDTYMYTICIQFIYHMYTSYNPRRAHETSSFPRPWLRERSLWRWIHGRCVRLLVVSLCVLSLFYTFCHVLLFCQLYIICCYWTHGKCFGRNSCSSRAKKFKPEAVPVTPRGPFCLCCLFMLIALFIVCCCQLLFLCLLLSSSLLVVVVVVAVVVVVEVEVVVS